MSSVFYGPDFITVTKASDANWAHIKPEVFSLITEAVTSGENIVNTVERTSAESGQEGGGEDTLGYNEEDDEVVGMIKELLETRIRPAIQEDGGDIEFRGFKDGMVYLKLRGACRTCDSSTVTLKNGIESMLMHYVSPLPLFLVLVPSTDHLLMAPSVTRSKRSRACTRSWIRRRKSRCMSLPSLKKSSDSRRGLRLLRPQGVKAVWIRRRPKKPIISVSPY